MNFDKTIIQRVLNKAYNNYLNTALVRYCFLILSIVTFSFYLEIYTVFETNIVLSISFGFFGVYF